MVKIIIEIVETVDEPLLIKVKSESVPGNRTEPELRIAGGLLNGIRTIMDDEVKKVAYERD